MKLLWAVDSCSLYIKRINYVYKFLLKFEDVKIYRIHMKCKNIWNIQTTVRVIIFNKWNKSLLRLLFNLDHFLIYVYKNMNLLKNPQSTYENIHFNFQMFRLRKRYCNITVALTWPWRTCMRNQLFDIRSAAWWMTLGTSNERRRSNIFQFMILPCDWTIS